MSRATRFAMHLAMSCSWGRENRLSMIAPPAHVLTAVRLRRASAMLGLIALVIAGHAAQAQTVAARGAEHEDFGRLVLDFTQPVASQIVADGAHMEVRLGSAASIDLAAALGNLKTYLK